MLRSFGSLGTSAWEVYDASGMTLAEFERLVGIANRDGASAWTDARQPLYDA